MKRKKERKERIKRGIEYREKAFKLQDTGNFKEAIEHFKKALEIFPVDSIRYGWTVDNLGRAIYFYCKKRMSEIDNFLETDEAKSLEKLLITWQNVKKC